MITQILSDPNMSSVDRKCLEEVLKRVNYERISRSMAFADTSSIPVSIPLFSYVFSSWSEVIGRVERVPGTFEAMHSIVTKNTFMEKLARLFVVNDRMSLQTRRARVGNEVSEIIEVILQVNPLEEENDSCQFERGEYLDSLEG